MSSLSLSLFVVDEDEYNQYKGTTANNDLPLYDARAWIGLKVGTHKRDE